MIDSSDREHTKPRHPIRVVAERTGLKPELLRAWENRYHVVVPGRSDGGHRLYSDADVEHLRLLHRATLSGRSIGSVADLPPQELARLVREDEAAMANAPGSEGRGSSESRGTTWLNAGLEAVRDLDQDALSSILRRAALDLGTVRFLREVAAPLIRSVGDLWHNGSLGASHEHLASVALRRVLEWSMRSPGVDPKRPGIVVGTPTGEAHEMGALLAAAMAEASGWRVIYLGPDLPASEIAHVALGTGARAVALSSVFAPDSTTLESELRELRSRLADEVTLLVGGSATAGLDEALVEIGVVRIDDLDSLGRLLEGLQERD